MRHFKPHEFACKCGRCGKGIDQMNPRLLSMLDEVRERAGIPLVIASAMRCPVRNKAEKGVDGSSHLTGLAVDIRCGTSQNRFRIIKAALDVGFTRIEAAPTWVHLDVDESKPQSVIFYPA